MQTSTTLRGDVWLVDLNPALGTEIQKTRPAVIVSNNSANRYNSRVVVVPVTSNVEQLYSTESRVVVAGRKGKAMCDQIRSVDKRRLIKRLDFLEPNELADLERALSKALGLALP
jgi:mRNA interferase MazF